MRRQRLTWGGSAANFPMSSICRNRTKSWIGVTVNSAAVWKRSGAFDPMELSFVTVRASTCEVHERSAGSAGSADVGYPLADAHLTRENR